MKDRDERRFAERYRIEGLSTTFTSDAGQDVCAPRQPIAVVDVNPYGALLHGDHSARPDGCVCLRKDDRPVLENKKAIFPGRTRKAPDRSDYTPITFAPPLSLCDLRELGAPTTANRESHPGLWDLFLRDVQTVKDEIKAIERCRSDIFLAIVTSIFLAAVTVGCLAVREQIHIRALLLGSMLAFSMFVLGAVTAVEKAKALNIRRAFDALLSTFLRQDWLPVTYQGWSALKYAFLNCGVRRALGLCAKGVPDKYTQKVLEKRTKKTRPRERLNEKEATGESCLYLGELDAMSLNKAKTFMPGTTDSFMSTCSYVYTILYAASIITLFFVAREFILRSIVQSEASRAIGALWQFGWFLLYLCGTASSLVLLAKYQRKIFSTLGVMLLTLATVSYVIELGGIKHHEWMVSIIMFLAGFCVGSVGSYLLRSLYSIRQGKNSYESYYFAWRNVIEHCSPMCDHLPVEGNVRATWFKRVLDYLARD